MRTPAVALVSAVASGAVMFFAGRMSGQPAGAPGTARSGPGVERAGEGPASPLDALKAKAAELPWAKDRGANGVLSAEAMESAIHSILSDPNPIEAMEKFTALLKELTPENAEAAWAAVKKQANGFDGMRYLSMLGYTWGKLDGPAAMKALAEDRSRESFMGRMSAMNGWATADSASALAWLQEQEAAKDPNEDQNARGRGGRGGFDETAMLKRSLVSAIAQTDPDGAMKLIATMPEDQRGGLMDAVVQAQLKQGTEAAAKWASSLTDPEMKKSAITGIAREYANQDPAAAAKWLSESGSVNADAAGEIAREWARKDPDATIAWLEKLPAGEAQANGYQDAFRSWSREDPESASTYLTTMETGPAKDSAVSALARSISREDPTGAIEWAATISDEKTRTETLVRAAQSWRMQDATAADAWISGSGLSAEVQQQMAEPMRFDRADFGGGGPPGFGGGGPPGGGGGRGRGR